MPKKLTPEKAKAYIDSEGSTCPYCGTTDISGGSLEVDAGAHSMILWMPSRRLSG